MVALVVAGGCGKGAPAEGHPVTPPTTPTPARATTTSPAHPTTTTQTQSDQGDGGTPARRTPVVSSPCLSAASVEPISNTLAMLARLDELMEGYGPPADTFEYGRVPPACLTTVAAQNDAAKAAAERTRAQTAQQAERNARAAHRARVQEWNSTVRPIAWTWDSQWQNRRVSRSAVRRFIDHTYGNEGEAFRCNELPGIYNWVTVSPAFNGNPYSVRGETVQPELTRRIGMASGIQPEGDQSCVVLNAVPDNAGALLTCNAGDDRSVFEIRVPQEAVAVGGVLANLGIGDLVRIHGHQILRKRFFGRDESRWQFDEVPLAGISVVETS